jgi:hypothetical protein
MFDSAAVPVLPAATVLRRGVTVSAFQFCLGFDRFFICSVKVLGKHLFRKPFQLKNDEAI